MTDIWDEPIRGKQYSIVTRRRRMERFMEDPTEETLKRLARSLWAYRSWSSIDFPVEERMLGKGHTPVEFRDYLRVVSKGELSTNASETPNLGVWVISELLEAMAPESYTTLNSEGRTGMEALGYPVPEQPLEGEDEYWQYVDDAKEAVKRYDLRNRLLENGIENVPDEVPTVDIAQAAFRMHCDDRFELDLSTVREG